MEAKNILKKTRPVASAWINFPRIAVNPQRKTIKCSLYKAVLSMIIQL